MTWVEHFFNQKPAADGSLPAPADCPLCGGKGTLTVAGGMNFSCSECGERGMAHELIAKLEAVPLDLAGRYNDLILNKPGDAQLPSWGEIQRWQNVLFSDKQKEVRSVLKQVYGLDENDLRANRMGLDEATGEVVLPLLNGTGANPSGVKRITLNRTGAIKQSRIVAVNRLLGYSYRGFQNAPRSPIILADNEFDRLYLQKLGFLCVTCADGVEAWDDAFSKLLHGRDVILLLPDAGIRDERTLDVLSRIAGSVKSLSRLAVMNVGNRPRPFIDEAIRNAPLLTQDRLRALGQIQAAQALAAPKIPLHPAQDFVEGQMTYGVSIGGEPHLLTYRGELLPFRDLERYSLIVPTLSSVRMTTAGVGDFVAGDLIVQPDRLLEDIKSYLRTYVVLTDETIYTTLAVWVMGSYVFRVFRTFPYIHLHAEKGSGKTTLMDIMHPIAFNGQHSANQSSAVIFRDVHASGSTLFLDEVECLRKDNAATYRDVISILNSGYRAGGRVRRLTPRREPEDFFTYSPKMFAGIDDITDTLDERSISVRMTMKLATEHAEEYKSSPEEMMIQASLRDKLYAFGLQYGARIWGRYAELEKNPYLAGVINRKRDLWGPLFTVAQIADEARNDGTSSFQDDLRAYMGVEEDLHARASEEENVTRSLLIVLKRMLGNVIPVSRARTIYRFVTEDAFEFIREQPEFRQRFKDKDVRTLTGLLSGKLGIKGKPQNVKGKSKRCYDIDLGKLNEEGLRARAWTQQELDQEAGKVAEALGRGTAGARPMIPARQGHRR